MSPTSYQAALPRNHAGFAGGPSIRTRRRFLNSRRYARGARRAKPAPRWAGLPQSRSAKPVQRSFRHARLPMPDPPDSRRPARSVTPPARPWTRGPTRLSARQRPSRRPGRDSPGTRTRHRNRAVRPAYRYLTRGVPSAPAQRRATKWLEARARPHWMGPGTNLGLAGPGSVPAGRGVFCIIRRACRRHGSKWGAPGASSIWRVTCTVSNARPLTPLRSGSRAP